MPSLAPKTRSASCMQVLEDPKFSRTFEYPRACLIGSVGNATSPSLSKGMMRSVRTPNVCFHVPQTSNSSDEPADEQATIAFARPQLRVAIDCMGWPWQHRTLTIATILTWTPWLFGLSMLSMDGRNLWYVVVLGESCAIFRPCRHLGLKTV